MTVSFLKGYRAFVNGGRQSRLVAVNKVEYFGGIEPFDDLDESQKKDWLDGIEYAKSEREECRNLWKKDKRSNNANIHKSEIARKKEEAVKLFSEYICLREIARRVGLSYMCVYNLWNAQPNSIKRNLNRSINRRKRK